MRRSSGLTLALLTVPKTAAAAPPAPCLNYEHREEFGSVYVDIRVPPNYTYVTWLWNIDDPTERDGLYSWDVLVNGRPVESHSLILKDDNLHSALPMATIDRTNWRRDDTFAIRAQHLSEGQNAIYVAVHNECLIP